MPSEQQQTQQQNTEQRENQQDDRPMTEKPEVEEKHKEIANEMRKEYEEDRPTVTMPGSGGTVSGTAVADWLDDDGNPKYGDESKGEGEAKDDS